MIKIETKNNIKLSKSERKKGKRKEKTNIDKKTIVNKEPKKPLILKSHFAPGWSCFIAILIKYDASF